MLYLYLLWSVFYNYKICYIIIGWLHKLSRGGVFIKNWKYRYFDLKGRYLRYYTDSTKCNEKGSYILNEHMEIITQDL